MTTSNVELNYSTFTEITQADEFTIQNVTSYDILIAAKDAPAPGSSDPYIILHPGQGITEDHIEGTIWGKTTSQNTGNVSLTA